MADWPMAPPVTLADAIKRLDPTSFWKLNETSGTFADSGSAGIAGTYGGGTRGSQGPRRGVPSVNTALDTALATFGDNYRFANRAPFTILVLHQPTTFATAGRRVACKQNAAETSGWQAFYDTSGVFGITRETGAGTASADNAAQLNEWNLLAALYDGTTLGTYVNGLYKLALADANNLVGTADALRINGTTADTASRGANGRYSHIAIWNRALSKADLDSVLAQI